MIPTAISDDQVLPGTIRQTFVPPADVLPEDNVRPCDALVSRDASGTGVAVHVRLALEPGELDALVAGQPVWLSVVGGLPPFAIQVAEHVLIDGPEPD